VFLRLLAVFGSVFYVFAAIGGVVYLDLSKFWLIPILAPVIYFIFTLDDLPLLKPVPVQPQRQIPPEWRAKIDQRIEELKNGPPHRNQTRYIDSVSRGIPYSDERIDYLEFPEKLVLCEHLRPLEAVMRAAKLPMDYYGGKMVEVQCEMQVKIIRERYEFDECVEFGQASGVDNHAPMINVIRCKCCGDSIEEQGMYGGRWPES